MQSNDGVVEACVSHERLVSRSWRLRDHLEPRSHALRIRISSRWPPMRTSRQRRPVPPTDWGDATNTAHAISSGQQPPGQRHQRRPRV
eukprot:839121-Pyramimonas_sp.AAC.1